MDDMKLCNTKTWAKYIKNMGLKHTEHPLKWQKNVLKVSKNWHSDIYYYKQALLMIFEKKMCVYNLVILVVFSDITKTYFSTI